MKVFFPFTLVQNTPTGMFVANGGETHDLPDDFAQSLIDSRKAEAAEFVPAPVPEDVVLDTMVAIAAYDNDAAVIADDVTAKVLGDDGEPLNPPQANIAADIANPAVIEATPKGKRGKIAASPLDAPVA